MRKSGSYYEKLLMIKSCPYTSNLLVARNLCLSIYSFQCTIFFLCNKYFENRNYYFLLVPYGAWKFELYYDPDANDPS